MYNYYQRKKHKSMLEREGNNRSNAERLNRRHITKTGQLSTLSSSRAQEWINMNATGPMAVHLDQGFTKLCPLSQHEFRDYNPSASVYVRNYMPEKMRVLSTTSKFFEEHYIQEPYDSKHTYVSGNRLRERNCTKEIDQNMKYNEAIRRKNINADIVKSAYNNDPLDTRFIHFPDWKPVQKKSFTNPKGFAFRLRTKFGGKYENQVWKVISNANYPNYYEGGFEETGDLHRRREKNKEVSDRNFSAQSPRDTWKNEMHKSTSMRTYHSNRLISAHSEQRPLAGSQILKEMGESSSASEGIQQAAISPFDKRQRYGSGGSGSLEEVDIEGKGIVPRKGGESARILSPAPISSSVLSPIPGAMTPTPGVLGVKKSSYTSRKRSEGGETRDTRGSRSTTAVPLLRTSQQRSSYTPGIGHLLHNMSQEEKLVLVKKTPKIYKKSLENFYFDHGINPEHVSTRCVTTPFDRKVSGVARESGIIMREQVTTGHWYSGIPGRECLRDIYQGKKMKGGGGGTGGGGANIMTQIRELRKIQAPAQNFRPVTNTSHSKSSQIFRANQNNKPNVPLTAKSKILNLANRSKPTKFGLGH